MIRCANLVVWTTTLGVRGHQDTVNPKLDKCNQTESSAADGGIFLPPQSALEGPSASTAAVQGPTTRSVRFDLAAAPQADRARQIPTEREMPRRAPRSLSPPQRLARQRGFAPQPLRFVTRFNLRQGMDFDKTLGHPGEGPSSGDSSDSEMQKWFGFPGKRTTITRAVRSPSTLPSEKARRSGAWSSWPPAHPPVVDPEEIHRSPNAGSGECGLQSGNTKLNFNFASSASASQAADMVEPAPNAQSARSSFWPRVRDMTRYLGLRFKLSLQFS